MTMWNIGICVGDLKAKSLYRQINREGEKESLRNEFDKLPFLIAILILQNKRVNHYLF